MEVGGRGINKEKRLLGNVVVGRKCEEWEESNKEINGVTSEEDTGR